MLLTGISLLGWMHSFACLLALFAGAYVLSARKGTRRHRTLGWWYASATVVQTLSSMGIYRFDISTGKPMHAGPHIFGIFHWLAVAMLVLVLLAIFAARRQRRVFWAHLHAQAMLLSYYILIGGLLNEAFVRILPLRSLALSLSPHAGNPINTMLVREFQVGSMMIWLTLVLWFAIKVTRDRRPPVLTIGHPLRYAGGALIICMGTGILCGALLGAVGRGVLIGAGIGIIASRLAAQRAAPHWGRPSAAQLRVMVSVIGLELLIFSILGSSGAFAHMSQALFWESSLAIVGAHFLLMYWSHGKWILTLGVAVLAWLGLGIAAHLPLMAMAVGDGLLKLGFGAAMAWPLVRPAPKAQAAPGCPQGSPPHPAGFAG